MDFPKIKLGQYAVVQAESATGIILNLDGKRHLGSGEAYLIFDSLDEAKTYSKQQIEDAPEIECSIYNHLNEVKIGLAQKIMIYASTWACFRWKRQLN